MTTDERQEAIAQIDAALAVIFDWPASLRRLRELAGISQSHLSDEAGYSDTLVCLAENGRSNTRVTTAADMLTVLRQELARQVEGERDTP